MMLQLDEDVKGATFAAVGSSAPELFVSLVDNVVSNPPKSVGVGTIVGSAIFSVVVVIGAAAVAAGFKFGKLHLDWKPLVRDSAFYVVSICGLVAVAVTGEIAEVFEGGVLMVIYALHLLYMMYNKSMNKQLSRFDYLCPMESVNASCDEMSNASGAADELVTAEEIEERQRNLDKEALMSVRLENAESELQDLFADEGES